MNLSATYTGTSCEFWKTGKTYDITINNNSMMVYRAGTSIKKVYRSLSDFFKDFNNVIVKP
jgi:hypothetical protein